jgi:hypothetical protein
MRYTLDVPLNLNGHSSRCKWCANLLAPARRIKYATRTATTARNSASCRARSASYGTPHSSRVQSTFIGRPRSP